MAPRLEEIAPNVGGDVFDEYGRVIGVLVSFSSNVDGFVEYVEVKITDRGIERIKGDRIKVKDGKVIAIPVWKHKAVQLIEALDRAYRRRKALESISGNELPADVVDKLRRKLDDEIKKLKIKAEESKKEIRERISEIDDESLHVASAIALLQMTYFAGEVSERNYTRGMNHLRKLKNSLADEKEDAKKVLDKLEKTIEAATSAGVPVKKPVQEKVSAPPAKKTDTLMVKIED
ncbi:MAG: CdvA-like protein [Desulfurococcales archaeon]|nr:CdvA-like protein [Desulfurococcales archaeon]